jgi:tetratricopeptide (TPR) repeat protein
MDLKLIDDYFQHKLNEAEKAEVENRILTDADFAEDMAFYTHSKAILREKILAEKHKEWTSQPTEKGKMIKFARVGMGVAASILVLIGIWFYATTDKPKDAMLAESYINTELTTLPLKMDAAEDSMELAKKYYNEKDYKNAIIVFESLSKKQLKAQEYLGLSYLQAKEYDKAIAIFAAQTNNPDLLNNKGKFYLALARINKGEKQIGEQLLKQVVAENLPGKKEAEDLLK